MTKKKELTSETVVVRVQNSSVGACELTFARTTGFSGRGDVDVTMVTCDKDPYHRIRVFLERGTTTYVCEITKLFSNGRTQWSRVVAHDCKAPELAFQLAVEQVWGEKPHIRMPRGAWNWGARQPVDPIW